MSKTKKLLIFFMLLSCFFVLIGSVSAADYHVKTSTTHKNIADWMKNSARSGNNLIFDVSTYNLTDTITINKAINVKSSKNTKINFNKNKDMFKVTVSGVNFSGLTLNMNGKGTSGKNIGAISASGSYKKINVKNTKININNNYVTGINILKWKGSASNCNIQIDGYSFGIDSSEWIGNLVNTRIISYGTDSINVYSQAWNGKIHNCKIYNYGKQYSWSPSGVILVFSKGTISKSTIKSTNSYAVMVSQNVKITGCSISSKAGYAKVYRYLPELALKNNSVTKKGSTYYLKIYNEGLGASKACYLGIKVGSSVKKVAIKALAPGAVLTVKIVLPSKYANSKYTKTAKIDYYNKIKEQNRKNNVITFK